MKPGFTIADLSADAVEAVRLMRIDRDGEDLGVHRWELGRFPEQTLREMRDAGFVLAGPDVENRFHLDHDESCVSVSTAAPDDGRPAATHAGWSSGVAVETETPAQLELGVAA